MDSRVDSLKRDICMFGRAMGGKDDGKSLPQALQGFGKRANGIRQPSRLAKGTTSEETIAIEQLASGCPGRAFRMGDFCAFVLGLARSMPSPFWCMFFAAFESFTISTA